MTEADIKKEATEIYTFDELATEYARARIRLQAIEADCVRADKYNELEKKYAELIRADSELKVKYQALKKAAGALGEVLNLL